MLMNAATILPWTEKYRPTTFEELVGQTYVVELIKNLLKAKSLPHLLFSGPPGSGKTSMIMITAKQLYKNNTKLMVMKLDASDDRGINSVRENIKGFAEKKGMFIDGIRLIILDEVDSMTFDAQFALRRIIEKYSDSIRFCLICNYENKIISPLKSRFVNLKFEHIDRKYILDKLQHIVECENIKYESDSLNIIINSANGDLRKSINFLQSISMYADTCKQNNDIIITENICCKILGILSTNELNDLFNLLTDSTISYESKCNTCINMFEQNRYSIFVIISQLFNLILSKYSTLPNLNYLIIELAKLEEYVNKDYHTKLHISYLVGIIVTININK